MSRKLPLYIKRSRYYRPSQPTIHDDSRGKDPAETTAKISSGRKEEEQEEDRHREEREEDRGSVGKRASTRRGKLMPEPARGYADEIRIFESRLAISRDNFRCSFN